MDVQDGWGKVLDYIEIAWEDNCNERRDEKVAFDYRKLRGKIREMFKTQSAFAKVMKMSTTTLSAKLNKEIQLTQNEIEKAVELLKIEKEDISVYFLR